jgi:uncharacterized RmlC-like cupin family protein
MQSMMANAATNWRTGVTVVRAATLNRSIGKGPGPRRATAFDFAGGGGRATWIGMVRLQAGESSAAHHHGPHEVAGYVAKGHCRIRWGARLEFTTDVGPGDFLYLAPNVPHQAQNLSDEESVDFVVVRSDREAIRVGVDAVPVAEPEKIF